jgi:DNA end-binding protein Ku
MAKSVWEGHLRLSLVTCPVALYKATDPKGGVAFHLINPKTKSRIVQVVKDPTTGEELDRKTLVRGFEVSKNQYVLFDPEELKALRIESTHVLDLERFVDAATIDRIYWDEPYYLAPSEKTGVEAFAVILEAMREKKRVGIGRLVLNTRERICALEPHDNRLLLTTLRTHEDIVTASDVGGIAKLPKPDRGMLDIAEKIIQQQEGKFDPSTFKDRYEDAVRDLIARKKRGQKVTTATPVEKDDGKVINLMEALRRSLDGQSSGSKERTKRVLKRKGVAKAKPKKKTAA